MSFLFSRWAIEWSVNASRIEVRSARVQPLAGTLVVDFTRYLPGAYASRELTRLGARVVRVEPSTGDPMRPTATAWDTALRAGSESVVCELPADAGFAKALCARADVVIEGFRPDVAARLGIGPDDVPETVVYCSITGFGDDGGGHRLRAGHDVNYLGWAGVLEDTAPGLPPLQIADLAAGALGAVTQILAGLLERTRTGKGSRLVVSMTHRSHDLIAHRLGGEPVPRLLTGGLACYRLYATADGRNLTVGALEPKFFRRLCELVNRPELAERQYDTDQDALVDELAAVFSTRTVDEWLCHFGDEDVCVGPVWTRDEAAAAFGSPERPAKVSLGAHTDAWRAELGV
jgi:crotonobetainyl-CoA:carnitine CoA-transferase CaiB-like acyl-CoA transferase